VKELRVLKPEYSEVRDEDLRFARELRSVAADLCATPGNPGDLLETCKGIRQIAAAWAHHVIRQRGQMGKRTVNRSKL